MGRRKRRQHNYNDKQQQYNHQSRYTSTFIHWGILSIVGSIFLFAIGLLFLYTTYFPSHPAAAHNLSVLTILEGPLIVEILLFLIGLASLIYGLRQRSRE